MNNIEQNSENTLYSNGYAVYNEIVTFNKNIVCKGYISSENITQINEIITKLTKRIDKLEKKRLALLSRKTIL